jgi:hypothetical protein
MPGDAVTPFKHCRCPSGFSGPRCAQYCPYDCHNGGYCTVTPIGESVGLTEQNDTAPNDSGAYMCKCKGRFAGPFCDIPYVNCGHTGRCFNGGVCEKQDDETRKCSCPQGYVGENCDIEVDKVALGDRISLSSMNGLAKLLIGAVALLGVTVLALVAICLTGKPGQYQFEHVHYDYDYDEEFSLPEIIETSRRHRGIQLNVV